VEGYAMKRYHYTECGLDNVWLENGFKIHETKYGNGVSISEAEQLHEVIAHTLINSPVPIRGQEVRFLRSVLDISQAALGKLLGDMSRDAIAKYEGAKNKPIPTPIDHLIRYVYSEMKKDNSRLRGFCDIFEQIEENAINEVILSRKSGNWKAA
jgi:putative transcriptional regulator